MRETVTPLLLADSLFTDDLTVPIMLGLLAAAVLYALNNIDKWKWPVSRCAQCGGSVRSTRLFTACAPSNAGVPDKSKRCWQTDAEYEPNERTACERLEEHLLRAAGTVEYLPRMWRRAPLADPTASTASLDYGYLSGLRPPYSDKSYCDSNYEFTLHSCTCGVTRYLNVTRADRDEDGVWHINIIRGLRVAAGDGVRLRALDPRSPR